jgi:hypothetical protein
MSSTNSGPSVTITPNVVVQAVPAGSSLPFLSTPLALLLRGGRLGAAQLMQIYQWQVNYAKTTPGVFLADPTVNLVDFSLTNGDPIGGISAAVTAYTVDGLHPSQRGAFWIGKAIADAVSAYIPDYALARTVGDLYDATNNPLGNLASNPFMTGTAGTAGTGASGSVATGYTAARSIGSTGAVVASKVTKTLPNGTTYARQRLVFTAPSGAAIEEFNLRQTVSTGITFGTDALYAEMAIDVSGITADSVVYIALALSDGTTTTYHNQYQSSGYAPNQSWSAVLRTPIVTPPGSATFVQPQLLVRIDGTVASAGVTVDAGPLNLRKA